MGDASLPLAQPALQRDGTPTTQHTPTHALREVNILVTGFGSFKSFTTNPSYLIATNLSRQLNPESRSASVALKSLQADERTPICDPDPRPFQVDVTVYPEPIEVAYNFVHGLVPQLVSDKASSSTQPISPSPDFRVPENGFDYVLHIGLAAGRDNYTLETLGHRDNYKLKDDNDKDGSCGETTWRAQGVPEVLHVGWNKEDVLARWEILTRRREDEYEHDEMIKGGWKERAMTLVETARLRSQVFLGKGRRATVKLSRDAGRYLCEFIFFTSMAARWVEGRRGRDTPQEMSKVGKVAFLHVPGGTEKHDIARGVRVAESAILAIAGSWEDGFRNPEVYGGGKMEGKLTKVLPAAAMYEAKSTGDQ